jgi:hypothetical protein
MAEEEVNEIGGMMLPSGDSNAGGASSAGTTQGNEAGVDPIAIDPMDSIEQENATHSEEEDVRDFIDMVDFYKTSKVANFQDISNHIGEFAQAYEAINQGCGCSKKNRIAHAEQKYLNLANLNEEGQNLLKGKLNAEKIRLFHQAGLFAEF